MFETSFNLKKMTLKLRRCDVVDLLTACAACSDVSIEGSETAAKWDYLHAIIATQLAEEEKT